MMESPRPLTQALLSLLFFIVFLQQGHTQGTVDLFIIAGQSNANGQALVNTLTPAQSAAHNALYYCSWHKFANTAEPSFGSPQYYSGWFNETQAGNTRSMGNITETYGSSPWFGPEIGFASRANAINLTTNQVGIIKYAVDGSALTTTANVSDWDLTATGIHDGDAWRGFQSALSNAVTALQNDGYTPNFRGMIWWQGENGTNVTALNAFVAAVRNHLGANHGVANPSTFPIVITGNDFWGAGLKAGVADPDPHIGFIDSVVYGQTGGYTNVHPGSAQGGNSTDVTGNGSNDMWDFGVAYADEMANILPTQNPTTYQITFINVDDTQTVQTVNAGVVATPPTGVNTATRTFTGWPTITPAAADVTYTALYTTVGGSGASVSASVSQSVSGTAGSTSVDLTAEGDLDWGVFSNSTLTPSSSMNGGAGYSNMSYLGSATDAFYNFHSQNLYSWSNGTPTAAGSNSLTTNASLGTNGDGIRLTLSLASAGSYRLKFYATTADTNLTATASLQSGGVSDTAGGALLAGLQRYEHTINFTTDGADTLTLDITKSGGQSILAYEAFSLATVSVGTTYQITFINVDGTQTVQTVAAGATPTPPTGVNTATRVFTAWPTIVPAVADVTYIALYEDCASDHFVDLFIATGQSNAVYPLTNVHGFGRGVQDALTASGQFSNPTVVLEGEGGRPIAYWYTEYTIPPAPGAGYDDQFFDTDGSGTGSLEAKINEIIANGQTPRFRGFFWWQGESDGIGPYANLNTSQSDYQARWNGLLSQLEADLDVAGVDSSEYKFVVNTVAESGNQINTILTAVANGDSRGGDL